MNFSDYFFDEENFCKCCYDSLNPDNFVLYKSNSNSKWEPFHYCESCITNMLRDMWRQYLESISKQDCKATLKRILLKGPPVNFREPGLDEEVYSFYFKGSEQSAKLEGSLTGREREKMVEEQQIILANIDESNKLD